MGRNDLVNVREAAEMLELSPKQVERISRNGIITPYHAEGTPLGAPMVFRRQDVEAYQLARVGKHDLDLPTTYARALRAEVRCRTLEHRLEFVESLLGVDVQVLAYDPTSVRLLMERVQHALVNPPTSVDSVMKWAKIFMAVHEEYFDLVAQYTGNPKPWEPFRRLGDRVRQQYAGPGEDDRLDRAHRYFNTACRGLRQAMYLYIRDRLGEREAAREMPGESNSLLERLMRHLPS